MLGINIFVGFFFLPCVVCVATSCRKCWLGLSVGGIVVG